jgi:hypothetical protein
MRGLVRLPLIGEMNACHSACRNDRNHREPSPAFRCPFLAIFSVDDSRLLGEAGLRVSAEDGGPAPRWIGLDWVGAR